MMNGKGYFVSDRDGSRKAGYATHQGGETNEVTLDVPSDNRPATMVTVPSGAQEYVPLVVTYQDRPADGLYIDELMAEFLAWHNSRENGVETRSSFNITNFKNPDFDAGEIAYILALTDAWCSKVELPQGDRSSTDVREMTVTIVHKGSTVTLGGAA